MDDDNDGWIDLADAGCADEADDDEGGYSPAYECNDGLDNDADGASDANDPDCSSAIESESSVAVIEPQGITMVPITAGTFEMGCTAEQEPLGCIYNEYPVHPVTLTRDFWLAVTEVTQGQYEQVMGENPSYFAGCENCPVEQVSWHQAAHFVNVLSAAESLVECYDCVAGTCVPVPDIYACDGYRLPTEAEWEYAARCGQAFAFAGSDEVTAVAWAYPYLDFGTQPVATKSPNGCGLYDLSGNVCEWGNDVYSGPYELGAQVDPVGAPDGELFVKRGGSWGSLWTFARVAARGSYYPSESAYFTGFRPARSIPQ